MDFREQKGQAIASSLRLIQERERGVGRSLLSRTAVSMSSSTTRKPSAARARTRNSAERSTTGFASKGRLAPKVLKLASKFRAGNKGLKSVCNFCGG